MLGIDLADRRPLLTPELAERAETVVTMGCGDECRSIPGKRYIDWDLEGRALAAQIAAADADQRERDQRKRHER